MDKYNTESNYQVEECSVCLNQRFLVNRTHKLCENCNCIRLHGMSLMERARQKKKEQLERQKEKVKTTPSVQKQKIPYFSAKGKVIHDEINEVKKQIRIQADDMNNRFCKGCNRGDVGLDCSHILSVAQRPDLATDKHNINLLCRICHLKHESFDIKLMLELKCFEDDMRYIFEHDEQKFNKVLFRLLDYVEKTEDSKAKKILANIEKFELD